MKSKTIDLLRQERRRVKKKLRDSKGRKFELDKEVRDIKEKIQKLEAEEEKIKNQTEPKTVVIIDGRSRERFKEK